MSTHFTQLPVSVMSGGIAGLWHHMAWYLVKQTSAVTTSGQPTDNSDHLLTLDKAGLQ